MANAIFTYHLTIKEAHLDTFGHVNNATYLTLLEEARWELITQNGYGLKQIQATGQGPTILEIKLSFLRELRLRENIVIETSLINYTSKIGVLEQKILRDTQVCSIAQITFGLFDLNKRSLVAPTPAWLKAIGQG